MQNIISLLFVFAFAFTATSQSNIDAPQILSGKNYAGPVIVGHRGGFDASLPENSISLFDFTYENSCLKPIAIEFDIRESASGNLYIMHDTMVDRTTNGIGKITNLTDNYIETLFLRDRNGVLTIERVPRFADVLQHFQDKNIILMLDVKGKILQKVITLVTQMHMESKCILLTFSRGNTKLAKEIAGKMMISALVQNEDEWNSLLALQIPRQQLIAYVSEETPIELIHEINNSNVLLMTDMSEGVRNKSNRYNSDYYKNFITKLHLGILISDYPLYVAKLFCNQ